MPPLRSDEDAQASVGEICSFENLLQATRKAEAGKRFQGVIGGFCTNIEAELLQLQPELRKKT